MGLEQSSKISKPPFLPFWEGLSWSTSFKMYSLLLVGVLATAQPAQRNSSVSSWRGKMQAAASAYERGRYLKAEELFEAALYWAVDFDPADERLPVNLNNLAEVYRAQGKFVEAESRYRQSVALWMIFSGTNFPYVAISLNNLALVYASQGRHEKAERLYQKSLANWRDVGGNRLGVANTLENYASLLREVNRNDEAAQIEQRARSIRAGRISWAP